MLMAICMQRGESRAAVMMVQGASVGPVFARRRCRPDPTSSHSERRSLTPLAPPPAVKQVPGGFSILTATCMQRGESRAAVMAMQGAASNTGGSGTRLSEVFRPRLRLTTRAYDIVLCEKKLRSIKVVKHSRMVCLQKVEWEDTMSQTRLWSSAR